jgi:hypothetical protein
MFSKYKQMLFNRRRLKIMQCKPSFQLNLLSLSLIGTLSFGQLLQAVEETPGAVETPTTTNSNGAQVIKNPDGSLIEIDQYGNKTIKSPDNTTVQIKADGTKYIQNSDGSSIEKRPDGTRIIKKPNGLSVHVRPDGSRIVKNPDGSAIEIKDDQ